MYSINTSPTVHTNRSVINNIITSSSSSSSNYYMNSSQPGTGSRINNSLFTDRTPTTHLSQFMDVGQLQSSSVPYYTNLSPAHQQVTSTPGYYHQSATNSSTTCWSNPAQSRDFMTSFDTRPGTADSYVMSSRGMCYNEYSGTGSSCSVKEESYSDAASDYSSDTCSDVDWNKSSQFNTSRFNDSAEGETGVCRSSRVAGASTKHRRTTHSKMTPEEEERRRVRRERNKLAAARCRQRRVDLTNQLLAETECLEDEKSKLEKEILSLQRQRTQLEFVLEAHTSRCHVINNQSQSLVFNPPAIKVEAPDNQQQQQQSGGSAGPAVDMSSFSRPRSLCLKLDSMAANGLTASCSVGNCVSVSTPLTFNSLGLDCMVDGHTGLTPITGPPSCGPTSSLHSPTTLMTL